MAKPRTILPTLLGIGLLIVLTFWLMREALNLSLAQRRQQRQVGDLALALARAAIFSENDVPPGSPAEWTAAANRLAAIAIAAGIAAARVESATGQTLLTFGRGNCPAPPDQPSGLRVYGDRMQVWDAMVLPASGKRPARLILEVLPAGTGMQGVGIERLLLSGLALGCGMVFVFLIAWMTAARGRRLELQLARTRAEREHHEELALAAAGLAHETKNPLGVIRGLAQQIAGEPGHPDTARRAAEIMEEADITTDRLGNFLRYARLRDPVLRPLAAAPQLERVAGLVADDFRAAGIELHLELAPLFILADSEMLSQAVLNLLLNSRKFTPTGGRVTLALRQTSAERAELSVADTGQGISADLLPNLFKPYVGHRDGHGLGLAMIRRTADLSGWKVIVNSHPGCGTTVVIRELVISTEPAS